MRNEEEAGLLRFKITLAMIVLMMMLLPFKDHMAVSEGSTWWSHFVYMFAHGNLVHLIVNAWALLMLHHVMRLYRVIAAYLTAVVVSFVYYPTLPVIGASTVIMFIVGYLIPTIRYRGGWTSVILLLAMTSLGMFIPQLAGGYHLICMGAGLVFYFIDCMVQRTWQYCTND